METIETTEAKKTQLEIVEKNSQNWAKLLEIKDPQKMAEFYVENPLFLPTFSDKLVKDNMGVKNYFAHFFEQNPKVTFGEDGFHFTSENSYTQVGMYDFEVDGSDNRRTVVHARFTFDFVKNDQEKWKILSHHSSVKPQVVHQN